MTTMRVGAGALRDTFSPDLLEEIRIMAEAGQARMAESLPRPERAPSSFAALLARLVGAPRPWAVSH